jgi:PBP1b-binding outer membrane lipoprotein LpoB
MNIEFMKRIYLFLIVLLLFLLSSCASKYATYSVVLDYRPYTTDGFLLTESNSVNFEYFPLGSVESFALSGSTSNGYKIAKTEDALNVFVEKYKFLRANGAINLKTTAIFNKKGEFIIGYRISGMAIKILPDKE